MEEAVKIMYNPCEDTAETAWEKGWAQGEKGHHYESHQQSFAGREGYGNDPDCYWVDKGSDCKSCAAFDVLILYPSRGRQ